MSPRGNSMYNDSTKGNSKKGGSHFALESDETKELNPNPDEERVNGKINAGKKATGGPPSDKIGAKNIAQKEKPLSFQVDEGWKVHSYMCEKGRN